MKRTNRSRKLLERKNKAVSSGFKKSLEVNKPPLKCEKLEEMEIIQKGIVKATNERVANLKFQVKNLRGQLDICRLSHREKVAKIKELEKELRKHGK